MKKGTRADHRLHNASGFILGVLIFFSAIVPSAATVSVASVFTDHAVLQQGRAIPVWGKARTGEKITVTYVGRSVSTKADKDGRWQAKLPSLPPNLAGSLVIAGENTITLNDVVTGEVWLCSGQSNMSFLLRDANDAEREIAEANHPDIREFKTREIIIPEPDETGGGAWIPCRPDSVGTFSAVAYFFARELSKVLHTPIGILTAADGGTTVETWTSKEAITRDPKLRVALDRWQEDLKLYPERKEAWDQAMAAWQEKVQNGDKAARRPERPPGPGHVHSLSGHFNGMIYPLIPYAIRGVLWYQGESNAPRAGEYERLCRTMIQDWRDRWHEGPFPFVMIQLPRHLRYPEDPTGVSWAFLREAQTKLLKVKNTGMAITLDLGDTAELHPKNKDQFAARAVLVARALAYGEKVPYCGPLFRKAEFKNGTVRITFDHTDQGLRTRDGRAPATFVIAGHDKKFVPAEARIEGKSLVVSSPGISEPVAVRYAWSNDPVAANLVNGAGLLASPFRTDDWPE